MIFKFYKKNGQTINTRDEIFVVGTKPVRRIVRLGFWSSISSALGEGFYNLPTYSSINNSNWMISDLLSIPILDLSSMTGDTIPVESSYPIYMDSATTIAYEDTRFTVSLFCERKTSDLSLVGVGFIIESINEIPTPDSTYYKKNYFWNDSTYTDTRVIDKILVRLERKHGLPSSVKPSLWFQLAGPGGSPFYDQIFDCVFYLDTISANNHQFNFKIEIFNGVVLNSTSENQGTYIKASSLTSGSSNVSDCYISIASDILGFIQNGAYQSVICIDPYKIDLYSVPSTGTTDATLLMSVHSPFMQDYEFQINSGESGLVNQVLSLVSKVNNINRLISDMQADINDLENGIQFIYDDYNTKLKNKVNA